MSKQTKKKIKRKKCPKKKQLQLIRSRLRQTWQWSWQRKEALNNGREKRPNGKGKLVYQNYCRECGTWDILKMLDVDHIIECGNLNEDNMGEWLTRLFCNVSGLQVLCKRCHNKKTGKGDAIHEIL